MTITPTRRLARGLAAAGAGTLAILTLSGCLSMTANLEIDSDAKATGSFAIGVEKQAAGMLGMTDIDAFTSGITNPETTAGTGDLLSTGDCVASETDAEFIYTCSFAATEFTDDSSPWTITKSGDVITFHLVNASADSSSELLQGGSLGELTVNATFPGEITSVTGDNVTKNSDTSITVVSSMTDTVDVTVTSKATGAGGSAIGKTLGIVGIVVLAIIVIALIAFLVMRRKKDEPDALAADGAVPVVVAAVVEETVVETTADGTEIAEETIVVEDQPEKGPDQV